MYVLYFLSFSSSPMFRNSDSISHNRHTRRLHRAIFFCSNEMMPRGASYSRSLPYMLQARPPERPAHLHYWKEVDAKPIGKVSFLSYATCGDIESCPTFVPCPWLGPCLQCRDIARRVLTGQTGIGWVGVSVHPCELICSSA